MGCGLLHGGAADVGLDPGQQLPHGEGLGDIVVRAQLQAQDLVGLLLPGGEHQNGGGAALLPDGSADVKAIALGQHQVQQNQIGVLLQRQLEPGLAVVGLQGVVALPGKVEHQNVHNILFILDDQDTLAHRLTLLSEEGPFSERR